MQARSSVHLGNAGEHLVMAHLLGQGFQAFMADRGNTALDISVVDGHRHSLIRVKTTSSESVMWSRKPSGVTFLALRMKGDYCCIVDMRNGVARADFILFPRTWFRRPSTKREHIWSRELAAMASRIRIVADKYSRSASETATAPISGFSNKMVLLPRQMGRALTRPDRARHRAN